MLETVEHSYTFPYAPLDVQKQSQKIISSIAECIEDIEKNDR